MKYFAVLNMLYNARHFQCNNTVITQLCMQYCIVRRLLNAKLLVI